MGDAAAHGVETLTGALFCVFQRDALWELHRRSPMMGFNVTWLTAHEESMVDDTLLSVGRRSAEERIASMPILLFKRAGALQPDAGAGGVPFPLTQQHIADGLGLSLVHTNKTLRKLERRGLEQHSCECYSVVQRAYKRLRNGSSAWPHASGAPGPVSASIGCRHRPGGEPPRVPQIFKLAG